MAVTITKEEFSQMWSGDALTEEDWPRVEGLIRRAARELELIVGDLTKHDEDLVHDTLIDAVIESQLVDNPNRYSSESDGGYSYTRYSLPSGRRSRFWWPTSLLELFGKTVDKGELRMRRIRVSPGYMGWSR